MAEISDQELKRFKLLAAAVDQTIDGIAFCDPQCQLLYVNKALAGMHGYTPEELAGKHISFFHNAEQMPQVDAAVNQVKATGKFSGVIWRVHRNGAVFPSQINITVFRDPKGLALGIIAVVRDMTGQSEEYFRALIENSDDVVTVLDGQGIVKYQSPNYKRLWGRDPSGEVGKDLFKDVHPEDQPLVSAKFSYLMKGSGNLVNIQVRAKREDGSWRCLDVTGKNLIADPAVRGVVVNFRDITEHRRAEEALLQTMKDLKLVNEVAIGNEVKLIEREREVNSLLKELGKEPKYG